MKGEIMELMLTLMRHGQTIWNAEGRWQGFGPIPLDETGHQQARDAAVYLQKAGITRIIASDLLRARQTAAPIAELLALPIETDYRWREVDVGSWQGLTREEIIAYDKTRFDRFVMSSYLERAFPDGETQQQQIQRTVAAMQDIARQSLGQHVLVVTHGGSIRCAMHYLNGDNTIAPANCSLTRLRFDGEWQVLSLCQAPVDVAW